MLSTPVASSHVPASQARGQTYAFHTCCVRPCPSQANGTDLCFPHLLRLAMSQPSSVILAATALHIGTVLCLPHLLLPAMSQPSSIILAETALHIGTVLCLPHLLLPAMSQRSSVILAEKSTPYRNSPMPSTPVASSHVPAKPCYITWLWSHTQGRFTKILMWRVACGPTDFYWLGLVERKESPCIFVAILLYTAYPHTNIVCPVSFSGLGQNIWAWQSAVDASWSFTWGYTINKREEPVYVHQSVCTLTQPRLSGAVQAGGLKSSF